ncbi:MAG: hypothetical protein HQL98_04430 [Magnetococcales bacterium]|nr:hypothetical protein [Magnetococcales bacterium]
MKYYLWILHLFALVISFLSGAGYDTDAWDVSLSFAAISMFALWLIMQLHFREKSAKKKTEPDPVL